MKLKWKSKSGVSPIIATILMVAVTVVLASVLYVLVSGYTGGVGTTPVSGALALRTDLSIIPTGNVTFILTLQTPDNPMLVDTEVTILNPDGSIATNVSYQWNHITSEPDHLKGGDRLEVSHNEWQSLAQYEVIVSISGYSGTFSTVIPN